MYMAVTALAGAAGHIFNGRHTAIELVAAGEFELDGGVNDSLPNGKGTLRFSGGGEYVGDFKDGEPDGQGSFTNAHGDKYVGEFKEGQPEGMGTLILANGDRHVGEFKRGKANGKGTLYDASGAIKQSGLWKDATLVQAIASAPAAH